jgi:hypothetical protein
MVGSTVVVRLEPGPVEVDAVDIERRDRLLDDPRRALLLIAARGQTQTSPSSSTIPPSARRYAHSGCSSWRGLRTFEKSVRAITLIPAPWHASTIFARLSSLRNALWVWKGSAVG